MSVRRVFVQLVAALLALCWLAVPAAAAEQADMEITQTGSPSPAAVGGELTWTIVVTNNGPGSGVNVEVNGNFNQYGPTTEFVSLTTSSGTCTHLTSTYNCQIGTVAAGATVTITLTVTVVSGDSAVSVADVTTGSSDADGDNNHVVGEVAAGPAADVRLATSASPSTVAPGDTVTYTLTVTNAGPTTASGVELSDTLPVGLVDATVDPSADCEVNGSDVSCSRSSLGSGQTFTATVEATVDPSFTGTELVNAGAVTSTTIDSDPSNNTASARVEVEAAAADLAVTKSATPDDPVAGEPVAYTIEVRNAGPAAAEGATLADELPASLTGASVGTDVGSCSLTGRSVACDFGTVPAGGVVTVSVDAILAPSASGAVGNTATVASSTDDPDPDNNTSTTTFTAGNSADLAIAKTGAPASVTNGDEVTYTLLVTNHGPSDALGAEVADELPDGLTYDSCTTPQGSCGAADDTVRFQLGTVAAGNSVQLQITATVADDFPGGQLANTARVSHDGDDPAPDNDEATHQLNVTAAADVTLAKTAAPSPVMAGSAVTFTLTARNAGPGPATDLVLTDAVPAAVRVTAVAASTGTCDSGLSNNLHCTLDDLAPDAEWTVTVTGTLDPATPRGTLRNVAMVTAPDDPTTSNNTAVAVVPVATRADLTITKTAPATVVAGERLTYSLGVTNAGPSVAAATVVVDRLPAGTSFVSGGGTGVTCAAQAEATALVVCRIGALAPEESATFAITVAVDPETPAGTTLVNRAQVSSATLGATTGLPAVAATEVTGSADLVTAKAVLPGVLVAGGHATYVLRVRNDGPSAAAGVQVTDAIPAGLSIDSVMPAGGTCNTFGDTVTCQRASLAVDATWVIVVHVTVDSSASGEVVNSAVATSATPDPDPGNNTGTVTAQVVVAADVVTVKTALFTEVRAGRTAIFFLSVVNTGPSTAADVVLSDTFPDLLTPTAVSGGDCAITGQQVTCSYPTLARGEIRTAMVMAAVALDAGDGAVTNTASATASTPDPDAANNTASADLTITADATSPGGDLATTGVSPGLPLLAASGLVALGAGGLLLLVGRKRRDRTSRAPAPRS
nr:DUF11 domain-containing protein [Propionicimonas sp.]